MDKPQDTKTAWVNIGIHLTLSARWAGNVRKISLDGRDRDGAPTLGVFLSPAVARDLAAQLLKAAEDADESQAAAEAVQS